MAENDPAASSASAYVLIPILGNVLVRHIRSLIPPRPDESSGRLASLLSAPRYGNMLSGHLYEAAGWTVFLLPEMTAVEVMPASNSDEMEVDAQTGRPMVVLCGVYLMRGDGPGPMIIRTKLQARAGLLNREEAWWVIEAEVGEDMTCSWKGYYGVVEDRFWGEYTVLGTGDRGVSRELWQRRRERAKRELQKYDLGDMDDWR